MKLNPLYNWDVDKTEVWIRAKMKNYAKFNIRPLQLRKMS